MGDLIYSAITSLDGYVVDGNGNFDWAVPSMQVREKLNDLARQIGTSLYGRRMYEVMLAWETTGSEPDDPPVLADYAAMWRKSTKIVYSSTLTQTSSAHTRIEQTFDAAAVRELKANSQLDLSIGGPTLAANALAAGLVDQCHQFIGPVVVGSGTRWLPDNLSTSLELLHAREWDSGFVHLHY